MSEGCERPIKDENDLRNLLKQTTFLKPAEQMDEQDPFPDLHDLTKCLSICAGVMESLVNSQSVRGINRKSVLAWAGRCACWYYEGSLTARAILVGQAVGDESLLLRRNS
jgi:hypothetical protein